MKSPPQRHALALAALLALMPGTPPVHSQTRTGVDWTDWTSQGPAGVTGSLLIGGGETAAVTFSGPLFNAFLDALPEPYWGPSTTYTGTKLANPPPNRDVLVIAGGAGQMKLSFSQAVIDPVLAIASLGLTNASRSVNIQTAMFFDQPFEVLSNGPNYYAGGQFTNFFTMPGDPKSLFGTESSGVIRFRGTFTELTWTSPVREENEFGNLVGTYMFTLGSAGCNEYELAPLTKDTTIRAACTAYTRGAEFTQQHVLDVRGTLRAETRHVTAGTLAVAAGGRASLQQGGHVAPVARISASGRLDNLALLNVAGRVETFAGSQWISGGLTVEPLAEVSVGGLASFNGATSINGLLQVKDSGNLSAFSPLLVGGNGARLELQGANAQLSAFAGLTANSNAQIVVGGRLTTYSGLNLSGVQLNVQPGGQFVVIAPGSVLATTVNAGTMSFQAGTVEFTAGSLVNSGSFEVTGSGLVALRPGMVFNNAGPGRIEVAGGGGLGLAGASVLNLGQIVVGDGGTLEVIGSPLQNTGSLQTAPGGRFQVTSGSVLSTGSATLGGDFLNQASFTNQGTLTIAPGRLDTSAANNGVLANQGTLRIDAPLPGATFVNNATLRNDAQLEIQPGAVLENQGSLFNNGTATVNGRLAIEGGAFVQSAGGHLAVNGILSTGGGLNLTGGSIGGSGVIDGSLVIAAGASALPGNSPGTLTVLGAVTLEPGARLELEVGASGAHDLLRAGSFAALAGSTVALRFAGSLAPDLDQTFDVIEAAGGGAGFGAATIEVPGADLQLDTYLRAAGLGDKLGVAFTPSDAQRIDAQHFAGVGMQWVYAGEQRLADSALGSFSGSLFVEGTFGLRRDAAFSVFNATVLPGGRLLSSSEALSIGRLGVQGEFVTRGATRIGAVRVDGGARWRNGGDFVLGHEDEPEARFVNRGLAQHTGGSWRNETFAGAGVPVIDNQDGARLEIGAPMSGAASVLNQGQFVVLRGARVQDLVSFVQGAGRLHVDGELAAAALRVSGGVVSGSGRIEGPVTLRVEQDYADPGAIVLRPGAESGSEAGGALAFTDRLEVGMGTALEFLIGSQAQASRLVLASGASFDPASAIRIVLLGGYVPNAETSWRLIDLGPQAVLEGFESVAFTNTAVFLRQAGSADEFWSGGYWSFVEGPGGWDMTLVPTTPVPEPGAWALMLAGAGVVLLLTRRRRLAEWGPGLRATPRSSAPR